MFYFKKFKYFMFLLIKININYIIFFIIIFNNLLILIINKLLTMITSINISK